MVRVRARGLTGKRRPPAVRVAVAVVATRSRAVRARGLRRLGRGEHEERRFDAGHGDGDGADGASACRGGDESDRASAGGEARQRQCLAGAERRRRSNQRRARPASGRPAAEASARRITGAPSRTRAPRRGSRIRACGGAARTVNTGRWRRPRRSRRRRARGPARVAMGRALWAARRRLPVEAPRCTVRQLRPRLALYCDGGDEPVAVGVVRPPADGHGARAAFARCARGSAGAPAARWPSACGVRRGRRPRGARRPSRRRRPRARPTASCRRRRRVPGDACARSASTWRPAASRVSRMKGDPGSPASAGPDPGETPVRVRVPSAAAMAATRSTPPACARRARGGSGAQGRARGGGAEVRDLAPPSGRRPRVAVTGPAQ